ncbi:MAG TPA: aminoglycoside phosphotransferase family protein [Acidimicrobiales bacterium]
MSADVRAIAARHLGRPVATDRVIRLAAGTDNVVYEVDGELIVRVAREPGDGEAVRREAALLAEVAELSPIPVPEPVFADPATGALAYRKLPGRPLNVHPVARPETLGAPLGELLAVLHRADPATPKTPAARATQAALAALAPPDDHPPAAWLEDAARDYEAIADHLDPAARRRVEGFLAAPHPPAPARRVFCHNDLGAEHLLVDPATGALTAVIDWTDAALTDPARDLALILRDLGPAAYDRTLAHYDAPWSAADHDRAAFYARAALLEDLAYGVRTGARVYAEAALAHLPHTFEA